jgi:MOSC domain-containing protein YiiM
VAHLTQVELEAGIASILQSPTNDGRLEMIVRRPDVGLREIVETAELTLLEGLAGDSWKNRMHPILDMQINIMNARAIALVARERDRWPLAGDQLYLDMDLSAANLPPGSQLTLGSAIIEITAIPHNGCGKFASRFGMEATRFVNSPLGKDLHLRGLNARVVKPGTIRTGELARKVQR